MVCKRQLYVTPLKRELGDNPWEEFPEDISEDEISSDEETTPHRDSRQWLTRRRIPITPNLRIILGSSCITIFHPDLKRKRTSNAVSPKSKRSRLDFSVEEDGELSEDDKCNNGLQVLIDAIDYVEGPDNIVNR